MSLVIAYWDIRGWVEPIHLLLEYLGVPYERKLYTYANREEWFMKDKPNLGVPVPNIPYLVEGDFKVNQSLTILKYLGRKYNMFGSESNQELATKESLLESVYDMRLRFTMLCYQPGDFPANKAAYLASIPDTLKNYDRFLEGKKWMTGHELYVGDFLLWSVLDALVLFEATIFDSFTNIRRFKESFESLPQIAKYLTSDKFKKFPINGAVAHWGGKDEQV